MLLGSVGTHVELHKCEKVEGRANATPMFPANTMDDVYVTENGNTLTQYLPTVKPVDSSGQECPLSIEEDSVITISDELAALLTS